MTEGHEQMDDMGAFAVGHKFHYIPKGCDQQGRVIDGVRVQAAEASTEIGIDDDQSESADAYLWWFIAAAIWVFYGVYKFLES